METQISNNINQIQKLIRALKALLKVEKNERDRKIHSEALERLKRKLIDKGRLTI